MAGTRHLVWFAGLLALAGALLLGSLLPFASGLEERGGAIVAPLSRVAGGAVLPLTDVVRSGERARGLGRENAALRRENARLAAELAALRESAAAADRLAGLIAAAGPAYAERALAAPVVLRDPAPGRDVIVIGRGERDGVRPGQPVLGPGGTIVGTIASAQRGRARVRLLSDPDSAVAAVVQSTRTQAVLAGWREGLRLEFAPLEDPIAAGDLVLTSALGGRLPGGLLAGRVAEVERPRQGILASVRVEPLADYRRLEQVLVLTGPEPAAAAGADGEAADAGAAR